MSEDILKSGAGGVCELRLDRPEKRNAITHRMYQALAAGLHAAAADEGVRVVLLSGAGASFCAGNDLNDFVSGPEFTSAHPVMDVLRTLATFDKPLVAAVQGATVGIGVTMLLHCDLVVAAQGTQLIMPFVALGLVPEAGSSLLLPRLVGQQRAAELLLLGEPLDAAAAERLGLVNRVVPPDRLLDEARTLAQRLVRQPVEALRATRRLLRGDTAELRGRIEAEAQVFGARLRSAEFLAQVRALLGKGHT
ncbi:MAG TPA: enoyl-CoA hydratase [Steroidobacteraceae bacterium]